MSAATVSRPAASRTAAEPVRRRRSRVFVHRPGFLTYGLLIAWFLGTAFKPFRDALVEGGIPVAQFAVDDVEAEHHRLTKKGVTFTQAPTDIGDAIIAVLDDTCGNLIQIIAAKKASRIPPTACDVIAEECLPRDGRDLAHCSLSLVFMRTPTAARVRSWTEVERRPLGCNR